MDELTIAFKIESPPSWLPIGRTAENNWRTVEIDCSYWFNINANGEVVLMYKPSCGMSPYPLLTERDGDNIVWRPKSGELVEGVGRLQAFFEVGTDVIGSSDMISCEVDSSLLGADPGTDPGQTDLPWALDIIEQIAELSGHYPKIVNGVWYVWSVQDEDYVSTGIEAQGEDGYSPTVTVTEIEGGHRVTITDADGAHTFDVLDGQGGSGSSTVVVTLDLTANPPTASMTASEIWEAVVANERVVMRAVDFEFPFISYNEVENTAVFSVVAYDSTFPLAVTVVVGANGEVVLADSNLARLSDLPNLAAYRTASAQDTIDAAQDAAIAAKYTKPSGGIPKSDLASAVQTSLGKADTAVQPSAISDMATKTWVENKGYQTAPFEIEVTQSGSTYSTTASAADILAHQDNCVAVLYGTKVSLSAVTGNEYTAELFFAHLAVNEGAGYTMAQQIHISVNNGVVTVLADMMVLEDIPSVTSADDGKFLRVVNGAWAAETVSTWQGGSY